MNITEVQQAAWANKIRQGFNTTDVPFEFGLLVAEVGEAFTAWRQRDPGLADELADVAIFLVALAEMNAVDLDAAVQRKLATNAARRYVRDANGVLTRTAR